MSAGDGVVLGRCEDTRLCPRSCTEVFVHPHSPSLCCPVRSGYILLRNLTPSQTLAPVRLSVRAQSHGSSGHRHSQDRSLLLSLCVLSLAHGFARTNGLNPGRSLDDLLIWRLPAFSVPSLLFLNTLHRETNEESLNPKLQISASKFLASASYK